MYLSHVNEIFRELEPGGGERERPCDNRMDGGCVSCASEGTGPFTSCRLVDDDSPPC